MPIREGRDHEPFRDACELKDPATEIEQVGPWRDDGQTHPLRFYASHTSRQLGNRNLDALDIREIEQNPGPERRPHAVTRPGRCPRSLVEDAGELDFHVRFVGHEPESHRVPMFAVMRGRPAAHLRLIDPKRLAVSPPTRRP